MNTLTTYHRNLESGLTEKYQKVAERLPSGSSVLEIGCHTGYFSRALLDRGHAVIGLEMNEVAAQLARDNGVIVVVADIEQPDTIEQIEQKFDTIILMDVLEHLRNPVEVLRRLPVILNSPGRVLITGPNIANWGVRKDLFFGKWKYVDAGILDRTHLHFYTGQGWRELAEEAGYQVTAFGPADGLVPLVHWLGKLPPLKNLVPQLHRRGVRLLPGLFAITYLIEAEPANH